MFMLHLSSSFMKHKDDFKLYFKESGNRSIIISVQYLLLISPLLCIFYVILCFLKIFLIVIIFLVLKLYLNATLLITLLNI